MSGELILELTIPGQPITKKNSQRILYKYRNGKRVPFIAPSKQFIRYQNECGWFIGGNKNMNLSGRMNAKCVYYMANKRKVDLLNLLEGTMDILVKYGVIKDDDSEIIASHDESDVIKCSDNPRVEITLTKVV